MKAEMNTSLFACEAMPSYTELFQVLLDFGRSMIRERNEIPAKDYLEVLKEHGPGLRGISLLSILAIAMTFSREIVSKKFLTPLGRKYGMNTCNLEKMPGCVWRLLFYSISWCVAFYLLVLRNRHFQQPSLVFSGWPNNPAPLDLSCLYVLEFSFYMHALYTSIFVDVWKKDSAVLIIHHIVTMVLLTMSYCGRYLECGSLIILFHDCCDVLLEFGKLLSYFKYQDNKLLRIVDNTSTICFGLFLITWFVSRLYLFPLKQLFWVASLVRTDCFKKMIFINMGVSLEIILLAMDIYWSLIILHTFHRIVTGQMTEIEDVRDIKTISGKKLSGKEN